MKDTGQEIMCDMENADTKRNTKKERQKILSLFYTNMYLSKIIIIILCVAGGLNVLLYWDIYWGWSDFQNETDSLLNAVIGYYCLCMPCIQNSYMSVAKNFNKKKKGNKSKMLNSSYNNDKKAYEMISILPVKKYELISMDIKISGGTILFLAFALIGSNVIYAINPYLEKSAGYFVIITLNSLIIVVSDFFAKYYYKHIAYIMELCGIVAYCILILVNIIMQFNSKIKHIVNIFLDFNVFKILAGIPMIVLCLLTVMTLCMAYKKTDFERGEMSTWKVD